MATAVRWEDNGNWELINDDGFVYKRKKRSCPDPTTATATATSASAPPDPDVEERNRRQRKKSTLLKLKKKYQKEILQWEHLSNTLSAMQKKTPLSQQIPLDHSVAVSSVISSESTVSPCRGLVNELLSQAEAQEAIIQDVSNLCDIVEVLCSGKEDSFKQTFTELPIWESPRKIISSLCDE